MKAKCIKVCKADTFMHEYIAVGTELEIVDNIVLRTDSFGFNDFICLVDSEYFEEHFMLLRGCRNCKYKHKSIIETRHILIVKCRGCNKEYSNWEEKDES